MPGKGRSSQKVQEGALDQFLKESEKNSTEETRTKSKDAGRAGEKDEKGEKCDISNNDLKELMTQLFKTMEKNIEERLTIMNKSIDDKFCAFKEKMDDLDKAVQSQDDRLTDMETSLSKLKAVEKLEVEVEELKNYITYQETRSRKYNVLIYGVEKRDKENVTEVVRKFFADELGIDEESIQSIIIQNTHRIPRNPNNTSINSYQESAPEAIIVKFARMEDRNAILMKARNSNLSKGKAVRTDLPSHLKKKRSILSQQAYKLRRAGLKTRIIEGKTDVELQYRKPTDTVWIKYTDA